METVNIILSIVIYLILPIIVIFGVIVLFRRRRLRDMGRDSSLKNQSLNKEDFKDIKAEESKEARHTKSSPENIDPETGRQPNDEDRNTTT